MFDVRIDARSVSPFVELIGAPRIEAVCRRADQLRQRLRSRAIWNINSTAFGGGVAEMLRAQLRYARGLGIDIRWRVLTGPADFFALTKRIHNALHGARGDGSPLEADQAELYDRVTDENARDMFMCVRAGDVVICHDPQTAGLARRLVGHGVGVVWRCHIGNDQAGDEVNRGWAFLRPYLEDVPLAVFTRDAYVPSWMPRARTVLLPPNIDPYSTKNQWLSELSRRAILAASGLIDGPVADPGASVFVGDDGVPRRVTRRANFGHGGRAPRWDTPLVVQVSRWDRMKDHAGVLDAFARLGPAIGAELVLAGPEMGAVADDPEAPQVLEELEQLWSSLPTSTRSRVQLVRLPMDDADENAIVVNALQRRAAIVVQKSLGEGFGLTVTEAMWKKRPVVASAVGGIRDQIDDGVHGLLVYDPTDYDEAASALRRLFDSPELGPRLGSAAYDRVVERYLVITSLERWADVVDLLLP